MRSRNDQIDRFDIKTLEACAAIPGPGNPIPLFLKVEYRTLARFSIILDEKNVTLFLHSQPCLKVLSLANLPGKIESRSSVRFLSFRIDRQFHRNRPPFPFPALCTQTRPP